MPFDTTPARLHVAVGLAMIVLLAGTVLPGTLHATAEAAAAPVPVVFVATGQSFADALSGGPFAAAHNAPMLFVTRDAVPAATQAALQQLQPQRIVILGGAAAVSDAVAAQLQAFTPGPVARVSGPTRFDTAAAIAQQLPARVHDAEHLRGLGPEAFTRSQHVFPFAFTLDFGQERVIAELGASRLLARCIGNLGGQDLVRIIATSSQAGWFASAATDTPQPPGGELIMAQRARPVGVAGYGQSSDRGHMMSPDGSYLGYQQEVTVLSVNVFGHDCVVAGLGVAMMLAP
jgi:hypothetical protein